MDGSWRQPCCHGGSHVVMEAAMLSWKLPCSCTVTVTVEMAKLTSKQDYHIVFRRGTKFFPKQVRRAILRPDRVV